MTNVTDYCRGSFLEDISHQRKKKILNHVFWRSVLEVPTCLSPVVSLDSIIIHIINSANIEQFVQVCLLYGCTVLHDNHQKSFVPCLLQISWYNSFHPATQTCGQVSLRQNLRHKCKHGGDLHSKILKTGFERVHKQTDFNLHSEASPRMGAAK